MPDVVSCAVVVSVVRSAVVSVTGAAVAVDSAAVVVSAADGEIRVRDNGAGMSPDVLDHAFIPFYTTKEKGTGIGLSLCRQIILKHGGTIRVESEEGKGTTFFIQL